MTFDTSRITLQWWSDGWHASFDVPRDRGRNRLNITVTSGAVEVDGMAYEGDESISLPRAQLHAAFKALSIAADWHEVQAEDPHHRVLSYLNKSRQLGIEYNWHREMDPHRKEAWFYALVSLRDGSRGTRYRTVLEAMQAAEVMG